MAESCLTVEKDVLVDDFWLLWFFGVREFGSLKASCRHQQDDFSWLLNMGSRIEIHNGRLNS